MDGAGLEVDEPARTAIEEHAAVRQACGCCASFVPGRSTIIAGTRLIGPRPSDYLDCRACTDVAWSSPLYATTSDCARVGRDTSGHAAPRHSAPGVVLAATGR